MSAAVTGPISVKSDTGREFYEKSVEKKQICVKSRGGGNMGHFCTLRSRVAGGSKSPLMGCLPVKWYQLLG